MLSVFGLKYLPNNNSVLIGPVISGFIAGCMAGKSYINGLVQGGLPAGIAGFIGASTLLVGIEVTKSVSSASNLPGILIIGVLLIAILYFMIFFIISSISGMIGAAIRKRINS